MSELSRERPPMRERFQVASGVVASMAGLTLKTRVRWFWKRPEILVRRVSERPSATWPFMNSAS
ncbi:hypothetical protein D3C83_222840 [compost metagenome]